MDGIELLKEFAKVKGINVKEVNEFLEKFNNDVKTPEDVIALPYDLQEHFSFVTFLGEPLQSFIMDEWYDGERYATLEVNSLVDFLYDRVYDIIEDKDLYINEVGLQNITIENEENKERLEELKAIGQYIVDVKFGSVEIDW